MPRTLIKDGTVVTATDTRRADVLVIDEVVVAVGHELGEGDSVIDASGRLVIPGGIDVHTHMERRSEHSDNFASGTAAAAWGGTTTIVDMATQDFGESLRQGLDRWMAFADGNAHIDYGFHMIIRDVNDDVLAEMDNLVDAGVSSFKLFMADSGGRYMVDDGGIFKAMSRASDNGALIMMHAENGGVIDVLIQEAVARGQFAPRFHATTRPDSMEAEAVTRAIALADLAGIAVYIVHLSSAPALEVIREARDRGVGAYAETCPHYLFLSEEDLARPGFDGAKYVCSPPLRPIPHQAHLWSGLRGDDLQVISTDHCPFHFGNEKSKGKDSFAAIPNGLPGVEDRLSLIWDGGVATGEISANRFVELVSTAPARLFGLHPRKGTIAPGSDADIVVFNPDATRVLSAANQHMNIDYSLYEGRTVRGVPEVVMQRGKVLVQNGKLLARPGDGRFLERRRSGL